MNFIPPVHPDKRISYYKETASTFFNFAYYVKMWGITFLNYMFVTINEHTDEDTNCIPPEFIDNSGLIRQGIVGKFDASPNC